MMHGEGSRRPKCARYVINNLYFFLLQPTYIFDCFPLKKVVLKEIFLFQLLALMEQKFLFILKGKMKGGISLRRKIRKKNKRNNWSYFYLLRLSQENC